MRNFQGFLFSLLLAIPSMADEIPTNRYRVEINGVATVATVTADLWLPSNSLAMFGVQSTEKLPNGQAEFLHDLRVVDSDGQPIGVKDLGEGDFELERWGQIKLSYEVRLEHDKHVWPAGVEEVSYHTGEGLMSTGFALFLAPGDRTDTPIEVELTLPTGWRATTPWDAIAPNRFRVSSRRELLSDALFFGTAHVERVEVGGVELTLLLGKKYADDTPLFLGLLRPQLASYLELFGGKPLATRYLIIINEGDSADGGAFASSFSQFIRGDADERNRVIWGHVMSHELLHFWNGLSLTPKDFHEEWFKEGVTDYLTITTTAQNGILDRDGLQNRLENISRRFLLARMLQGLDMSVRNAGEDKQPNRLLVYAGGSLAALALDIELRKATENKKGLPDVMRELYREFGKAGAAYELNDVAAAARRVGGSDFSPLLSKLVESTGPIDLGPYLSDLGLRLDHWYEEQFISADADATPEQKARFAAIFGTKVKF